MCIIITNIRNKNEKNNMEFKTNLNNTFNVERVILRKKSKLNSDCFLHSFNEE